MAIVNASAALPLASRGCFGVTQYDNRLSLQQVFGMQIDKLVEHLLVKNVGQKFAGLGRAAPLNDLISNFALAEIDGDRLDDREVLLTTTTLIMAPMAASPRAASTGFWSCQIWFSITGLPPRLCRHRQRWPFCAIRAAAATR